MDWDRVIERSVAALKRIPAALVAMAGDGAASLPRALHRAVLRQLRPAEAAARRLIIVAARDIVVTLRPARLENPKTLPTRTRKGGGTCIVLPGNHRSAPAKPRRITLPLLDTLPRCRHSRTRFRGPNSSGVPRILVPGFSTPHPVAPWHPPLPDDPLDATRLHLRVEALGRALDDVPAHARRFARWRTRRDAVLADARKAAIPAPIGRRSPLRPGAAPGIQRRGAGRSTSEVDRVLGDLHHFALMALALPDTS